jgi:predicted O-methyltransferase YrrM
VGDALETLPALADEGHIFDFIFIDANKEDYPAYLDWSIKLSRKGTAIFADNVVRGGGVLVANSTDPSVQGTRQLIEMFADDPRVDATAIQTVGSKGYDGFALAIVL